MHGSAQHVGLPQYRAPHHISWFIGSEGRFLHAEGSALDLSGRSLAGRHYEDLYADAPVMLDMFKRLFDGETFSGTVDYLGRTWQVEAAPVFSRGHLLGISGMCVSLEREEYEDDATREVEIAGDMPEHHVWSGDRFLVRDGRRWVTQVRIRPLDDYARICIAAPERVHTIKEPSASPLRHLRLLR